jgi:hypothetical protein
VTRGALMAMEEPPSVVALRGDRFFTYRRVEFILKWYSELAQTRRLPVEAEEEASNVLGTRSLWQTEQEWSARLCAIDKAWTYLDGINADQAIWLWRYYVERKTIDQISRQERCRFYTVQGGIRNGVSTMVRYLNGEV